VYVGLNCFKIFVLVLFQASPTSFLGLHPWLVGDVAVHQNRDDRGTEALHAFAHIKSRPEDALPKVTGCSLVPCFPDPGSCRPKRLCHATNYYNPARCARCRRPGEVMSARPQGSRPTPVPGP